MFKPVTVYRLYVQVEYSHVSIESLTELASASLPGFNVITASDNEGKPVLILEFVTDTPGDATMQGVADRVRQFAKQECIMLTKFTAETECTCKTRSYDGITAQRSYYATLKFPDKS